MNTCLNNGCCFIEEYKKLASIRLHSFKNAENKLRIGMRSIISMWKMPKILENLEGLFRLSCTVEGVSTKPEETMFWVEEETPQSVSLIT